MEKPLTPVASQRCKKYAGYGALCGAARVREGLHCSHCALLNIADPVLAGTQRLSSVDEQSAHRQGNASSSRSIAVLLRQLSHIAPDEENRALRDVSGHYKLISLIRLTRHVVFLASQLHIHFINQANH